MRAIKLLVAVGTIAVAEAWADVCVDGKLPAGNIIVESVSNGVVRLRQDYRDSYPWFYWAFRVTGAEGTTSASAGGDACLRNCRTARSGTARPTTSRGTSAGTRLPTPAAR